MIHIKKDTLRLVKCASQQENEPMNYSIEFKYDSDVEFKVTIYHYASESFTNGSLKIKSVLNEEHKLENVYEKGSDKLFKNENYCIIPSNYNKVVYLSNIKNKNQDSFN